MLHSLSFFRGSQYDEVSVNHPKAFLLGVRRVFVRLCSVVLVLACCVTPSFAEFSNTDSQNLNTLKNTTTNIYTYLSQTLQDKLNLMSNTLSTMSGHMDDCRIALNTLTQQLSSTGHINVNLGNIVNNTKALYDAIVPKLDTMISKFDTTIALLQSIDSELNNITGELKDVNSELDVQTGELKDVNSELDMQTSLFTSMYNSYFASKTQFLEGSYTISPDSWQLQYRSGSGSLTAESQEYYFLLHPGTYDRIKFVRSFQSDVFTVGPILSKNQKYKIALSFAGSVLGDTVSLEGCDVLSWSQSSYLSDVSPVVTMMIYIQPRQDIALNRMFITFDFQLRYTTSKGCPFTIVLSPISEQEYWDEAGDAGTNPDQDSVNNQIGDAVADLDDFDNTIFTDFDKYKSDLDFGLSAWGEAAAGINYIGNIFMIVWDNSPNQVIVLSLMIGLCSLVLGRGARLAGAVRRRQESDSDG